MPHETRVNCPGLGWASGWADGLTQLGVKLPTTPNLEKTCSLLLFTPPAPHARHEKWKLTHSHVDKKLYPSFPFLESWINIPWQTVARVYFHSDVTQIGQNQFYGPMSGTKTRCWAFQCAGCAGSSFVKKKRRKMPPLTVKRISPTWTRRTWMTQSLNCMDYRVSAPNVQIWCSTEL